jgi:hypothetical protein
MVKKGERQWAIGDRKKAHCSLLIYFFFFIKSPSVPMVLGDLGR